MARICKKEISNRLRALQSEKAAVIATAAGIGIAAKCQQIGGSDLILVDMAARMRMAGFGSMTGLFSVRRANSLLLELAAEILPIIDGTPVLAGVAAAEPFEDAKAFLARLAELGFSGVFNSPSVGWNDEFNATNLSKLGLGYEREVEMIAFACRQNLFALGVCYGVEQAEAMASAGADVIVANLGLTAGGLIGAKTTLTPQDALRLAVEIANSAKRIRPEVFVLCTGAHLNTPEAVKGFLDKAKVLDGFYGGSAIDRIPMEEGMISAAKGFKDTELYRV